MKIDFLIIHGIGRKINVNDYITFIDGIKSRLPKEIDINFIQINYSEILDQKEDQIYEWMKELGNGIRKWACYYICDVLAFSPTEKNQKGDWYYDLNKSIEQTYKSLRKDSKKVVFGHSLGSQIALSNCYSNKFDLLITAGSPIIYFSIKFKDYGSPCPVKKIVNFYNPNDLVSTKVGANPHFKSITEDFEVKPSLFFRIPLVLPLLKKLKAHTFYWSSKEVHKKIADELVKLSSAVDNEKIIY
jgi:hypothetical protein